MKYFTLVFLFLFIIFQSQLSAQGCDEFRYLNEIATTTSKVTVQFGENVNGLGLDEVLEMDIYTPDGDSRTDRPVIIYAFGGSFIGGSRAEVSGFCERYARKGYVTAAIDYRLYSLAQGIPDSIKMLDTVVKAISDMKAAVRFLRKSSITDGNPYGIHPDLIYAGGISAGAIVALHAAYITPETTNIPSYLTSVLDNNGGLEGNTDLPGDSHQGVSSAIQAVVNHSGALHKVSFMEEGGAPVVSVHGDNDDTVPYGYGFAQVFNIDLVSMEGSSFIHAKAQDLGIPSDFYSVDGGGHVDFYGVEPHYTNYETMIINFLHDEVTCKTTPTNNLIDFSNAVKIYPNPSIDMANIIIDGIDEVYSIQIMDQLGKIIKTISNINDSVYTLNRENLATGMYNIQINFDNPEYAPINKRVVFR